MIQVAGDAVCGMGSEVASEALDATLAAALDKVHSGVWKRVKLVLCDRIAVDAAAVTVVLTVLTFVLVLT
jgi:hypothetical protein